MFGRKSIITNTRRLAKTPLRRDALEIIEAGYQSINVEHLFTDNLSLQDGKLKIGKKSYRLDDYENVYVVGVGKGSSLAAQALERTLHPKRIAAGYVIDIVKRPLKKIVSFVGTHPLPSEANIEATRAIIDLLGQATKEDLVITIICGGGSALFCKPGTLTALELQFISLMLLRAGASIKEINTVRKHTSLIHGGYLAKHAFPATVLACIVSDVPGNDISMVSSGPTVKDKTTVKDAARIMKKYDLPTFDLIETPKESRYFKNVTNVLIASGSQTVDAMAAKARELGYKPRVFSRELTGFANEVGPKMAANTKPGEALLACGETEVIVTRPGKGGRNQDVALSALATLPADAVIISAASDGKDNVDVAGAIADGTWSVSALKKKRLDPTEAVRNNASYNTLHALDDHLQINKITANISDFVLVLRGRE